MEEQVFNRMVESATEAQPQSVKDRIRQSFENVRAKGELLTLSKEEVELIEAYRLWRADSTSVTGVFHYKRKK